MIDRLPAATALPLVADRAAFQAEVSSSVTGRPVNRMYIICYLRDGDRVYETYWTTIRGVEAMDNSYALMDLTVFGRQEPWEDSPAGWPQNCTSTRTMAGAPDWTPVRQWPAGRPTSQWPRPAAAHSDELSRR